jgi:hypothetical protein
MNVAFRQPDCPVSAMKMLFVLRPKLQLLQDRDRLPVTAAEALVALTDAVIEDLQGLALERPPLP